MMPVRLRPLIVALLLAAAARAGDFVMLGLRDDTKEDPDAKPPRTTIAIDVLSPRQLLETRRVTLLDAAVRRRLFEDPFVYPARPDLAYLVCREEGGLRVQRLSWSRGEDVGKSRHIGCDLPSDARPRWLVTERIGFLGDRALVSVDLRLGTTTRTPFRQFPYDVCPVLNRVYVSTPGAIAFYPVTASDPPKEVGPQPPQPLLELPDDLAPVGATVTEDALRVAYVSESSLAFRFLLSVADNRGRLLVRRSVPGRLHDLRWLDNRRLLLVSTRREEHYVHVLDAEKDFLTTSRLPVRYLAPPTIVLAEPLALKRTKN